jgi:hypothetical protein
MYNLNACECAQHLLRLQKTLAELNALNKQSREFLRTAYKTEVIPEIRKTGARPALTKSASEQMWRDKAAETRKLADRLPGTLGKRFLLEIAETYDGFAEDKFG